MQRPAPWNRFIPCFSWSPHLVLVKVKGFPESKAWSIGLSSARSVDSYIMMEIPQKSEKLNSIWVNWLVDSEPFGGLEIFSATVPSGSVPPANVTIMLELY